LGDAGLSGARKAKTSTMWVIEVFEMRDSFPFSTTAGVILDSR
jgi:hypothetical protein